MEFDRDRRPVGREWRLVGPRLPSAGGFARAGCARARAGDLALRKARLCLACTDGPRFRAAIHSVELVVGKSEQSQRIEQQHARYVSVLVPLG